MGEWVDVLVPGLLEQLICRECGRAGFEQRFEHGALFLGEVDGSSVAGDSAGERVEFDAGGVERPRLGRWRGWAAGFAARERADAQDEFGEVERLGELIIGAEREPGQAIVGGAGGGQHQDHCRVLAAGDDLAELIAVDAGKVAVTPPAGRRAATVLCRPHPCRSGPPDRR